MEISGTIDAIGPKVAGLAPGQPVVALPIFGGHAERVTVPAKRVFPLPDGADLIEGAAVAVTFLTAWYACHRAQVSTADRVVVTAAAGGVGTALLQILKERGATVVALVGSEEKLALCRELGAAEAGLYASADGLVDRILGGRADVVIDAVGGRLFSRFWKRLEAGGRYVFYGFAAASGGKGVAKARAARELLAMGFHSPYGVIQTCRTLIGFNLSLLPDRTGELRRGAEEVFALWKSGRIRPILGPRFDFERLPDAHRALASRKTTGKVVVTVP